MKTPKLFTQLEMEAFILGFQVSYAAVRLGELDAPFTTCHGAVCETISSDSFKQMIMNKIVEVTSANVIAYLVVTEPNFKELSEEEQHKKVKIYSEKLIVNS